MEPDMSPTLMTSVSTLANIFHVHELQPTQKKMSLNSYQMVRFPQSSRKHFHPKIVLSSAPGQGQRHWCDCGSAGGGGVDGTYWLLGSWHIWEATIMNGGLFPLLHVSQVTHVCSFHFPGRRLAAGD